MHDATSSSQILIEGWDHAAVPQQSSYVGILLSTCGWLLCREPQSFAQQIKFRTKSRKLAFEVPSDVPVVALRLARTAPIA